MYSAGPSQPTNFGGTTGDLREQSERRRSIDGEGGEGGESGEGGEGR